MFGITSILESAKKAKARVFRRTYSAAPTSNTPESNNAWMDRQFKYYSVPSPFAGPLTLPKVNLTGETWEMRQGYRQWALTEPSAKASLLTKCMAVAQLDPILKVRQKNDKRGKDAARWCDYAVAQSEGGWSGLSMNVLLPGLIDGFSVNEKYNSHIEQYGSEYHRRWYIEKFASIDTQDVRFLIDQYREVKAVQSVSGANMAYWMDPDDFLVFTHLKIFENPFGVSDMRAAVRACRLIESAIRLRHILLTNHSGPFIKASSSDATGRANLIKVMEKARANGWIVCADSDKLEVLNLATANIDTFRSTIEDYQQEIVRAIQGAYLQLLEGGISNGRGNTQVHGGIAQLFQWWLAEQLGQLYTKHVIPDLCIPSYGYQSEFPRCTLGGIDEEFMGRVLDRFKKGHELGLILSQEQVRDAGGFEIYQNEQDKLPPPAAQQQQQGNPFAGPTTTPSFAHGGQKGGDAAVPVATFRGDEWGSAELRAIAAEMV